VKPVTKWNVAVNPEREARLRKIDGAIAAAEKIQARVKLLQREARRHMAVVDLEFSRLIGEIEYDSWAVEVELASWRKHLR